MKISVVIPTYNRAGIISGTLDSVLAQSYQDWECIVVDDNSTDNTKEVIDLFCLKDKRFRYLRNNRKKGAQGARNTGILASDAEWVCIFDSDDLMHPDFLEKLVAEVDDETEVVSCWGNRIKQSEPDSVELLKWGGDGNILKDLLSRKAYVNFDSAIIRRKSLCDIGLLDEDIKAYQEFDTHIRLSRICRYKSVREPLFDYITGSTDTISVQNEPIRRERYAVLLLKYCKLWRRYAYSDLLRTASYLFYSTGRKCKSLIARAVPEVLILAPFCSLYFLIIAGRRSR